MSQSPVDTFSPAWRLQCEAREVSRWTPEERKEFYESILKIRGQEATNELIEAVNQVRRASR